MADQSSKPKQEQVGKRSGDVDNRDFHNETFYSQLDPIIENVNSSNFKYDRKGLANLLLGLQQFMEVALGKNAPNKPFPKIPAKLFTDLRPDGPLSIVARLCADLMKSKGQKRIDWVSPATRKENTDLILRIRQQLMRDGYIRSPCVFIMRSCPHDSKLRHIVTKLGGDIAQSENDAGVTHVVHPFPPTGDPDDGQHYCRTLIEQDDRALVHWWFLPDSYDEWIPSSSAPEREPDSEAAPPGGRPWNVYVRWVTDSDLYNEWMNEVDYETDESTAENKRIRESGEGNADVRDKKKARKERVGPAAEVAPGYVAVLGPGAVQRRVIVPFRKTLDQKGNAADISHGQRQSWASAAVVPVAAVLSPANEGVVRSPESQVHRIPMSSTWFSLKGVGEIERREFSEYYTEAATGQPGARHPAQYVHYRNTIINKFRENVARDLTFVEVLRSLDGDANDVRKVFDFLQRWGLINFRGASGGVLIDHAGAAQGANTIIRAKRNPGGKEAAAAVTGGSNRVVVRRNTFNRAVPDEPAVFTGKIYYCTVHPHEDVTRLRYHCTKIPDVDLCPLAYADGRFPPGCSAKDFVRVEYTQPVKDPHSEWTDQERMLLLEALEVYGDDWNRVSEHVGGKSAMECVQQLLELPIEETLMTPEIPAVSMQLVSDRTHNPMATAHEHNGDDDVVAVFEKDKGPTRMPFEETANPAMVNLAFISSLIGGRVAGACAQRMLEVIAEKEEKKVESNNGDVSTATDADCDAAAGEISGEVLREATAAGFAAAATQARLLAEHEEREMQRLVLSACEIQFRRINTKMEYLEEIDAVVQHHMESVKVAAALETSNYKELMGVQHVILKK